MTRLARRGLSLAVLIFGLSAVSALAARTVLQLWTGEAVAVHRGDTTRAKP